MPRYYFDIRDDDETFADDEGLELADARAAEIEAAENLTEMAKAAEASEQRRMLAIEARTVHGPVIKAALIFDCTRH